MGVSVSSRALTGVRAQSIDAGGVVGARQTCTTVANYSILKHQSCDMNVTLTENLVMFKKALISRLWSQCELD